MAIYIRMSYIKLLSLIVVLRSFILIESSIYAHFVCPDEPEHDQKCLNIYSNILHVCWVFANLRAHNIEIVSNWSSVNGKFLRFCFFGNVKVDGM